MSSIAELCQSVKAIVPDQYPWYVITVCHNQCTSIRNTMAKSAMQSACLVACGKPEYLTDIYCTVVRATDREERDKMNRRLRDILQKIWILTGIAPVLDGFKALADGERNQGHENDGTLSEKWQVIALTLLSS